MRAIQLSAFGLDHLDPVDLPAPRPGPHEVLVRMEAASLNFRDQMLVNGDLYRGVPLPIVPVSDGAGTVLEVGEAVARFKPGDRVTTFYKSRWIAGAMRPEWEGAEIGGPFDGVMRELACFDQYSLARAPTHLSSLQAATLPIAALTAWQVLETARVTTGQTVLLLGTGGVSLFALQFARLRGARAIVLSSSDEKLERAKALGADVGINYKTHPRWGARVREASGGAGVDVVVETIGAATLAQSLEAVRMHGTVAILGWIGGNEARLPLTPVVLKRIRLQGISVAPLEAHERMVAAIEATGLEPVIDHVYGFGQLREAFEHLAAGRHFGKLAIGFDR
ncbi:MULTISPECIES: NAD(P)-dependent alcohol dehydrogenase [unclassified Rhodanobacter]|uniref:zinc-dependent alcohol dehydrogenase family protein n=1 Tax=unclassified Rhodanobacter TaxID=2621553 RepID=UPI001BDDD38B|nr:MULTISPECIES: NAD(P)-dependent alcohol dehydrogenase [unclassified Rhodanobacter]MBT2143417.1 NAD(P)-dependent alcohol dehydrogenase [Rhodanobacter sp. LX-99]MBT2147509.1 NAD(P)-dependent alcohol dehydrogenase [Rhodanobacter sp. LX-100]